MSWIDFLEEIRPRVSGLREDWGRSQARAFQSRGSKPPLKDISWTELIAVDASRDGTGSDVARYRGGLMDFAMRLPGASVGAGALHSQIGSDYDALVLPRMASTYDPGAPTCAAASQITEAYTRQPNLFGPATARKTLQRHLTHPEVRRAYPPDAFLYEPTRYDMSLERGEVVTITYRQGGRECKWRVRIERRVGGEWAVSPCDQTPGWTIERSDRGEALTLARSKFVEDGHRQVAAARAALRRGEQGRD